MPKAIVIEDEQVEHAVRVVKVSSSENSIRDAARHYQSHHEGTR